MTTLGNLTSLQTLILRALAGLDPPWTLTGGAALVGIHLRHRITRDLDLFWHGHQQLGTFPSEVEERLKASGLQTEVLQRSPAFCRLRVRGENEVTVLDLIAEPVPTVDHPQSFSMEDVTFQVDTIHEILVNKLCALLSRSELRDLFDVQALLQAGVDLETALTDAPRKDGGFSPLTLVWILQTLPIENLGQRAGLSSEQVSTLQIFSSELIDRITQVAQPDDSSF